MVNSASVKSLLVKLSDELQMNQGTDGTALPSFAASLDQSLSEMPVPVDLAVPEVKGSVPESSNLPSGNVAEKFKRNESVSSDRKTQNSVQVALNYTPGEISAAPVKLEQRAETVAVPSSSPDSNVAFVDAKPDFDGLRNDPDGSSLAGSLIEAPVAKGLFGKDAMPVMSTGPAKAKAGQESAHKGHEVNKPNKERDAQIPGESKALIDGLQAGANQQIFTTGVQVQLANVAHGEQPPTSDAVDVRPNTNGLSITPHKSMNFSSSESPNTHLIPKAAEVAATAAGDMSKGENVVGHVKQVNERAELNAGSNAGGQIESAHVIQNVSFLNPVDRGALHVAANGSVHMAAQVAAKEASVGADAGIGLPAQRDALVAEHRTVSATPSVLEVGVANGADGWLKIRAELTDTGTVKAALSSSSTSGQEMLHRELPALSGFLDQERVPVSSLVVHPNIVPMHDAAGVSNYGGGAGQQAQGGHAGTDRHDQSRDFKVVDENALPEGLGELQTVDLLQGGVSGGGWLSVRA